MSRLSAFCLIACGAALAFSACNSDSETLDYEVSTSAIVKSFSFEADDSVLVNLDKVFFSIDLDNGNIFNADSMPYGTDTHALIPVITTGGASAVELVVPRPGLSDTTYNYLENSTDSIDFSNGPVLVKVCALDQSVTMTYTVNVNVHQVKSDSLVWSELAYAGLPGTLAAVDAQHTVKFKGAAYCLTSNGNDYCMSVSTDPASGVWENKTVNFGFNPDIESLRASSEALYILSTDGDLFQSDDNGVTWTSQPYKMDYLIGGYDDKMVGTVKDGTKWSIVMTDGTVITAPSDFPVLETSTPIQYTFPMSSSHQMTIVGGRKADGSLSGSAWGFDGTTWANLSIKPLPVGLEGVSVFPYFIFEENMYWVATKESIFVAMGGRDANGDINGDLYISYDYGMNWAKAPVSMQLPSQLPSVAYAQTLVFSSLMQPRSANVWNYLMSRASRPITSWDCPYVYRFGGVDADGRLQAEVWRGVINRLMFKPLQ